jgi:hypothetical protein
VSAFDAYTARLEAVARGDDRVLGLVLLGSGADPSRIDEWSDHDFALIVSPEAVAAFRGSVGWIPDAPDLAVLGREWHDGFKGIFDDGRVIEFAVTDLASLRTFPMAVARVVFDRTGDVSTAVDAAIGSTSTRGTSGPAGLAAAMLTEILVGVGRLRRGERLSGADVIRSGAALSFVDLWLAVRRPGDRHPDPFNGWRRIESVDAAVTAGLEQLLAQDAESAARGILELAETEIAAGWADWPSRGAEAVRRRLGW